MEFIAGDWRHGVDPARDRGARSAPTRAHAIKAVCVVHNETSTGVTQPHRARCARAIDAAGHPALLLVDTISSLGSIDYRHDEWGVDVTVAGSQKGLMLPPGLSFNAVSDKALAAAKTAKLPRSYWDWDEMLAANENGFFPYTPATNLLYGLHEAIAMLLEEGLANVFARHRRHARGDARRGARLGPRDPVSQPARIQPGADRGADARGPQRRRACARSCWSTSTCRWARGSASSPARCSASATWATSTT